eukprot:4544831-Pyramimonas_sp.AAC.1
MRCSGTVGHSAAQQDAAQRGGTVRRCGAVVQARGTVGVGTSEPVKSAVACQRVCLRGWGLVSRKKRGGRDSRTSRVAGSLSGKFACGGRAQTC